MHDKPTVPETEINPHPLRALTMAEFAQLGAETVVFARKVTGDKLNQKTYWRHSGFPGGIKSRTLGEMLEKQPEEVIPPGLLAAYRSTESLRAAGGEG